VLPQPIVINTSKAFPALKDLGLLGGSVDALSAMARMATGMIRIRCRHCPAPTRLAHWQCSPAAPIAVVAGMPGRERLGWRRRQT
jgi:hypothetical protein